MRRACAAALGALMLALSGCTLSIYNNYRDIESLEVVRVLGLDAGEDGALRLSAATGADASGREPLRISGEGESLEGALRALDRLAGGGRLFFAGTGAIVLGEGAAGEASRWLDAVARSRELRLDAELYVLRGGSAGELICGAGAQEDAASALSALASRASEYGPAPVSSCAGVSRALIERGAAAATAIRLEAGADGGLTAVPAGFALLTDGGLAGYLDGEAAFGAGLFLGGPGTAALELGGGVTAEAAGAALGFVRLGDARLRIDVELRGSVAEAPSGADLSGGAAWAGLEAELAALAERSVLAAVEAQSRLGADFLGLARRLEREGLDVPAARLPELEIEVSGRGKLINQREYARSPYPEEKA